MADAPAFVADIGGTHARFARVAADGRLTDQVTLAVAQHPSLQAAVEHWWAVSPGPRPVRAAIAVATPVDGDWVSLTNADWQFSIEAIRSALGLEHLRVINDFTALAWALPALGPSDRRQVGGGLPQPGSAIGVIGPGTGLGVGGLVADGDRWIALAGEGGHCTFSPADARECAILAHAWQSHPHVSCERLVSGLGLPLLLRAVAQVDGLPWPAGWDSRVTVTPAMILRQALQARDPLCTAALETFCAMLGTAAGNLALTLGARGGVYVGGGLVPRLGGLFDASGFRARFEAKGRFTRWLSQVPTWVIESPQASLAGAARALTSDR